MNKHATATTYDIDCDQALAWIARLRADNVSAEDHQQFALWMAEGPTRRRAMDDMLNLWDDLGAVEALPFPEIDTRPAANQSRWFQVGAAMAAACLVATVALWPFSTSQTPVAEQLQTALGEQRTFELSDGSQVTLNTDSRMNVSFSAEERRVELVSGEAFFEVTSDIERPFTVDAGVADATVVGTAFNIYRTETTTAITVTEGVVRVTERDTNGLASPKSNILRADEQVFATGAGLESVGTVDTKPLVAWRNWELVANDMRLYDLIQELQRYDDRRVVLGDRSIASLKVSGVFPLDQPEALLQAVSRALELQLVELDGNVVQLLKAAN
ncbi:MAG: FecR domain-containing protein [Halieaceae bacterium]